MSPCCCRQRLHAARADYWRCEHASQRGHRGAEVRLTRRRHRGTAPGADERACSRAVSAMTCLLDSVASQAQGRHRHGVYQCDERAVATTTPRGRACTRTHSHQGQMQHPPRTGVQHPTPLAIHLHTNARRTCSAHVSHDGSERAWAHTQRTVARGARRRLFWRGREYSSRHRWWHACTPTHTGRAACTRATTVLSARTDTKTHTHRSDTVATGARTIARGARRLFRCGHSTARRGMCMPFTVSTATRRLSAELSSTVAALFKRMQCRRDRPHALRTHHSGIAPPQYAYHCVDIK
jgi:hypothetical protein